MKFAKYTLQLLIVGMLLMAFLPVMPASAAATVVDITISESITRHDTYQPADPNTAGTVAMGPVTGSGTITLTNNAGFTLSNVDLVFTQGHTTAWTQAGADTTPATVTNGHVQIASFPAGASVHVNYDLDPATAVPPVTLSATYTRNSITDNTASSTVIHLTATLNAAALPSDVSALTPTITLQSADHATRGTQTTLPDWVLSSTSTTPGATLPNSAASTIAWSPALTTAAATSTIDVTAMVNDVPALNDGAGGVSLYDIATSTVTYTVTSGTGSSSGITLTSGAASSPEVQSTITKQFTGGQWVFTPEVSVPGSSVITYELTSITEWAVDSTALSTTIQGPMTVNSANHDASHATWPFIVDATHPFVGIGANELLQFAYNGIPVGFMKPVISIQDTPSQFGVDTGGAVSQPGSVDMLKRIYIINGYQVEVVKTITPGTNAGEYHINIVATNLGTAATPPHVFVYDIIPALFYSGTSPSNMVPAATSHQQLTAGPNNGDQAFWWDIGTLTEFGTAGDSATIDYDVSGTGAYDASDLYVVGVDPAQSVNLQTTPLLSNAATMVNANFETLAALGAAGLLVIGMIGTARRRQ